MPAIDVTSVHASELGPDLQRIWSALQESHPDLASPYFSFGFTRLVSAARADVHVGILRRGDRIVGFFPFQRRDMGEGEPLAHASSDFHGVVAAPTTSFDPVPLLRSCGLR